MLACCQMSRMANTSHHILESHQAKYDLSVGITPGEQRASRCESRGLMHQEFERLHKPQVIVSIGQLL